MDTRNGNGRAMDGEIELNQGAQPQVQSNAEIADRLASLAQLLSTQKENPYKVKGLQRAPPRVSAPFPRASTRWCAREPT